MTQEEKRIKLAEAAGWKLHPKDRFIVIPPNSPHSVQPLSTIPDYFNDLNAVQGLLVHCYKKQPTGFLEAYSDNLEGLCSNRQYPHYCITFASAEDRAEALGKTLNLW